MRANISSNHPIRALFHNFVEQALLRQSGSADPRIVRYLANVLVEFTHRDQLFRIRDFRGRRLEQVAEMMLEGDVALNATSFEREREVHKHIGDFTLFWTGVYPEMLRVLRAATRRDHLVDYVEQGRRSYEIAATFNHDPYGDEAPVLRQLADNFERCVLSLQIVRREMDLYGSPEMTAARRLLQS
ncbi:MAG: hypothetical protein ACK47B_29175 [Armatimonadota bacterium]